MIKKFLITGDTHGNMSRFKNQTYTEETAIIILGDAGCNYFLDERDHRVKMELESVGCFFYLVRGNHESRVEALDTMIYCYDKEVDGYIYVEQEYPRIRYLCDGGIYSINGYKTLVIGGAYSVDKWYRLQRGWRWFEDELLTIEEMNKISNEVEGQSFDLVLTHTCPLDWEPIDLFLGGIDQTKVDTSMEVWMNTLKDKISWKVWLFAHFHTDRAQQKGVEICYLRIEPLEDIMKRNLFDFS